MSNKNVFVKFFKEVRLLINVLISMAGYVPEHATIIRTIAILASFAFSTYLTKYYPHNFKIAVIYYLISVALYMGFITLVLRKNGYRLWFIKKWGAKKGYLIYEGILGFIFFNMSTSLVYVPSSTPGSLFDFINNQILIVIVALLFAFGFIIKLWAAKVVTIDIYYWKDMFLGKKICKFVVTGPYKYFSNPMYGVGQLHGYAIAIYYGSVYGLAAVVLSQCLIFTFYYTVEKKFIQQVYQKKHEKKGSGKKTSN